VGVHKEEIKHRGEKKGAGQGEEGLRLLLFFTNGKLFKNVYN
jgi:hypothetical protein